MQRTTENDPAAILAGSWPQVLAAQRRLHEVREKSHRNFDGGDAGHQWDHGLVVRHAVNYAVAVAAARRVSLPGPVVDVGAGAGGFSVWAAAELSRRLVLVDQDAGHRELAARAFPDVAVRASTTGLDPAPVVLAMEVVEHVPRADQPGFVRSLAHLTTPGGVVVVSTPDESRYWGGWSGYRPHVAPVTAGQLAELLRQAMPGWRLEVLRVAGPGFDLSGLARYGVPVANRVWGSLDAAAPRLTHEVAYRLNQLGKRRPGPSAPQPGTFAVVRADQDDDPVGTGLVALVRRP